MRVEFLEFLLFAVNDRRDKDESYRYRRAVQFQISGSPLVRTSGGVSSSADDDVQPLLLAMAAVCIVTSRLAGSAVG